ncbi:LytTR family DNA-binding domain-containing protein [Mycoplasmatota bacterium WC44]
MFKLKPNNKELSDKLNLVETTNYNYVLTTSNELCEDNKINIVFNENHTHEINKLLDLIINGEEVYLTGHNERGQKRVEVRSMQYVETFGDDVYLVMQDYRLLTKNKLYQLEEILKEKDFIRVSKSHLVNIGKIRYIKPAINSKIELIMNNDDIVEVKRTYLKNFKETLKI